MLNQMQVRLFTLLIALAVCFRLVNLLVDSFLNDVYVPFGILLNLCCSLVHQWRVKLLVSVSLVW